jgi:CDP-2,3-bis-(O-geranylgeranyl)-sn-glycerol synthase
LPRWNYPLDFNQIFRGQRILGSHKTWRGLIIGILAAFLFFIWQKYLYAYYPPIRDFSLIDYNSTSIFIGAIMGLGAILGDAVKSFFKRQLKIAPGRPWFPFDQLDFLIGGVLLSWPFIPISSSIIVVAIGLGLLLHLLFKVIGYIVGVDKTTI